MGGKFHLKLNIDERPIANKYREGKMKRTLERELKALEIVEREANGIGYGRREIISGGFRCPRVGGRKLPISGSEFSPGCARPVDRPESARFTVGRRSEGGQDSSCRRAPSERCVGSRKPTCALGRSVPISLRARWGTKHVRDSGVTVSFDPS